MRFGRACMLVIAAMLLLCALSVGAAAQSGPGMQDMGDAELLKRVPQMSLEQLEQPLETYYRPDNRVVSKALAGQIPEQDPNNKQAFDGLADERENSAGPDEEESSDNQAPESEGEENEIDESFDDDTEEGLDILQSEIDKLLSQGYYDEAIRRLRRMKGASTAPCFPYQYELADALLQRGELPAAQRAYAEILADPKYEYERDAVCLQYAELKRLLAGGLRTDATWMQADEGSMWSALLVARSVLSAGDWRVGLRGRHDHISLDRDERKIRHPDKSLYEGECVLEKFFPGGILAGLSAGASESRTLLGATFEQIRAPGYSWGMSLAINERTEDSLQLTSLHGRQDALHAAVQKDLMERLQLDLTLFARRVHVSADHLGSGYGGEADLGYTLFDAGWNRPSLTLSYVGEVNIFNHRNFSGSRYRKIARPGVGRHELQHDLIEQKINRHGPGIGIDGNIGQMVAYEASSALLYDLHDRELQYVGEARITVALGLRWSLYLAGSYESNGRAANANSSVVCAQTGIELLF